MGTRLSMNLIERSEWERCLEYEGKSKEELNVDTKDLVAYDFCTDAIVKCFNKGKVKRLTMNKLDVECDIFLGILDKVSFKNFVCVIGEYAKKFSVYLDDIDFIAKRLEEEEKEETSGCGKFQWGYSWTSAFYSAVAMYKVIDWDKYVVYCEVG